MKEDAKFGLFAILMLMGIVAFVVLIVSALTDFMRMASRETDEWKAGRRAECVQMLSVAQTAADSLTIYAARSDCARVED